MATFAANRFVIGLSLCVSCDDISTQLSELSGDALGEGEQLIDGPLVIGISAVLHRVHPSGGRNQEVGWETQWATGKPQAKMPARDAFAAYSLAR